MSLIKIFLLFALVTSGGLLYFLIGKSNAQILKLSLAFSGAYLFAITVTHLIPEVYHSSVPNIGVYVLAGFIFQILLEYFSEGIEHGHIHVHKHHTKAFPLAMMLSLCVHSFFEGMPLADESQQQSLLTGIILHHMPVAFALMSMLQQSKISKAGSIAAILVFAAVCPIGALTGNYLTNFVTAGHFEIIMAIVIGIFLHISTTILFESDSDHRFNFIKMFVILAGVGLALVV